MIAWTDEDLKFLRKRGIAPCDPSQAPADRNENEWLRSETAFWRLATICLAFALLLAVSR